MNLSNVVTWETQHNNADWDCFQDSDFAGDLEDSKSSSGGNLVLANLDGSFREYTRGNTKIIPILHVTVSYLQVRYEIEIRINSLCGDGSHSWVMIGTGLNKYVTEMSEEVQENRKR